MTWKTTIPLEKLQHEQQICIELNQYRLLLIWHQEKVYAIENRCSHAFKPLYGGQVKHGQIQCPYHGACFSLETGAHLSPPAFKGIQHFPTRIKNHQVEVEL